MQCSLVVHIYHGTSHLSLAFAWYTHSPKGHVNSNKIQVPSGMLYHSKALHNKYVRILFLPLSPLKEKCFWNKQVLHALPFITASCNIKLLIKTKIHVYHEVFKNTVDFKGVLRVGIAQGWEWSTSLYGMSKYVRRQRVGVFSHFGHKQGTVKTRN